MARVNLRLATCSKTEINEHPVSLGVTCCQYVESPAVVGLLDRNYRYKSVAFLYCINYITINIIVFISYLVILVKFLGQELFSVAALIG